MENKNTMEIFNISKDLQDLAIKCEESLVDVFKEFEEISLFCTAKIMKAFLNNKVSDTHFKATTGYGYDDLGRETIEKVYSEIFGAEDALVRIQIVNGTHALSTSLFACLKSGDIMLSITGAPYDTLNETIGTTPNSLSLISRGVKYKEVDLKNNKFDLEGIKEIISKEKIKLVFIGRSRGYTNRKSMNISEIAEVISLIKEVDKNIIVMVDNCYGEFVECIEPTNVGADIIAGSLIKNIGGGLCETGGYILGKKELVSLASEILTAPGIGKECGASLGKNKEILQGLFTSPSVVKNALKVAAFTAKILKELGYEVNPEWNEKRTDIIQSVILRDPNKLISFIQGIQSASPIDSFVTPEAWNMPGYSEKVIMAAGTFVSGASIELSADAPIKEPYIAYIQGGITYESAKLAVLIAIDKMKRG